MGDFRRNRTAIPRVGIIGCGRIGSLWDEEGPDDSVWTHASAYQKSGRVELVALADPDAQRLQTCCQRRGVAHGYLDYRQMLTQERLDIVSVCTPSSSRYDIFATALQQGVRYFYCEKPVAHSLTEALRLQTLLQAYPDACIMVNYLRRWEPGLTQLRVQLQQGQWGRVQRITAYYGKGLINNGTHFIDLFRYFFGEPAQMQALRKLDDGLADDVSVDARLQFETAQGVFPVDLLATDHRLYSVFEWDIFAEKGRIQCPNLGPIRCFPVAAHGLFAGYSQLQNADEYPTDLGHSMVFAVAELVDCYQGKQAHPRCGFSDGLQALQIADRILHS